jgi:CarD family transcriptional regulator
VRLTAGDKIVYPSQGPCLIGPIVERIIGDRPLKFYQIIVLNKGGDLFVPVDKVNDVGIRRLLGKSEIPKLLNHLKLKRPARTAGNWRQRAVDVLRLFASGSAFDLAEVVETLTELGETKALSFVECRRLDRAKWLLICEISEVTGETTEEAEKHIDKALAARKEEGHN